MQDEPFHANQTQKYCQGRFREWDPKITTFPGLYAVGAVMGVMFAKIASVLPGIPQVSFVSFKAMTVE